MGEEMPAKTFLPRFGNRPIADIKRSDVVRLLDHVEDERGPAMAELVIGFRAVRPCR
jgi:hypothetical protein